MSLAFSDTSTLKGIIQVAEDEADLDRGVLSDNTNRLKKATAHANIGLDIYTQLAIQSSGRWQYDDSNHTDFPTIEADLVSGQRDYTFVSDENGNLILDIYRVFVKDRGGTYIELTPKDQQKDKDTADFWDGENRTGVPTSYDKTANGILFDLVPNYNWRNANEGERGVKLLINRESSYFTYTDTTKKPGVPGIHHHYFALQVAKAFAPKEGTNYSRIVSEILLMERKIQEDFSLRPKDEVRRLTASVHNNR